MHMMWPSDSGHLVKHNTVHINEVHDAQDKEKLLSGVQAESCKLVLEENQKAPDVARTLGIPVGSLNRWVRTWRDHEQG